MSPMEEIAAYADVPMAIDVEIGRPPMRLGEVLALRVGKVISLERSAGENIDVRVGGALIGYGEVIVSENGLGIRLTDFKGEE